MIRITHSLVCKAVAVFLFVLTAMGFIGGIIGTALLFEYGFYDTSVDIIKTRVFESITWRNANIVFNHYFIPEKYYMHEMDTDDAIIYVGSTNFLFILKDQEGRKILGNYTGQEYSLKRTYRFTDTEYMKDADGKVTEAKNVTYTMDCFVKKNLDTNDNYYIRDRLVELAYKMRYAIIIITVLSLILSVVLFIYLLCSAGRKAGINGIVLNGIDRVPFDVLIAAVLFIVLIEVPILNEMETAGDIGFIIAGCILAVIDVLLFLLSCMSFAARYKAGGWWRNTLIYRIVRFLAVILAKVYGAVRHLFINLSIVRKTIAVLAGILMLELLMAAFSYNDEWLLFFGIVERIILIPVVLMIAISLQKLKEGGQKIAAGDLDYQVDTSYMFWDFKDHGLNLNQIGEGMSRAVEERLKSERFRTELITNVSHDIKTPLTSIINYVDLLKKENIEDEKLKEYIDVLDRQSSRLKKLTEDLLKHRRLQQGICP